MVFFWIRLKSASTLAFWLAALIIPLTVLGLGFLFSQPAGLSINIGIYGSDTRIAESLRAYGSTDWTLIQFTDREALRQNIANRRLELGYAFGDDGITLYVSPAAVTDRVANLLVAAAYLETTAGDIGARSLNPFMAVDADAHLTIQNRADAFLTHGPLMERVVIVHENASTNLPDESVTTGKVTFRRLFHGLLALFSQLLAMLCAMHFANKSERNILRQMKAAGKGKGVAYTLSGAGVVFVLTGIVMTAVVIFGGLLFPGVWVAGDVLPLLAYLIVVSGLAVGLARWLPDGVYPGVLVMGFVFTALMGGVFFDLREVLAGVGWLRFLFPAYYYMMGV